MKYLIWNEKTITDFSENNISAMYDTGYVFTRAGKGVMHQTRSARVDLAKFNLSSENRRILKKVAAITMSSHALPIPAEQYDWQIGKLAKDFYETKFGPGIMSAAKVKELITDSIQSHFNVLMSYNDGGIGTVGHVIAYANKNILHYCYPFYDLEKSPKDMGLGMMTQAVEYAKNAGAKYIYLGSLQRPNDTYKLQFEGLEWFDGKEWKTDEKEVRDILAEIKQ